MKDDKKQNTRFVVCHITGMSEDEYDKLGLGNHASIQEEEILKSYQYKLLDSIVELAHY